MALSCNVIRAAHRVSGLQGLPHDGEQPQVPSSVQHLAPDGRHLADGSAGVRVNRVRGPGIAGKGRGQREKGWGRAGTAVRRYSGQQVTAERPAVSPQLVPGHCSGKLAAWGRSSHDWGCNDWQWIRRGSCMGAMVRPWCGHDANGVAMVLTPASCVPWVSGGNGWRV